MPLDKREYSWSNMQSMRTNNHYHHDNITTEVVTNNSTLLDFHNANSMPFTRVASNIGCTLRGDEYKLVVLHTENLIKVKTKH